MQKVNGKIVVKIQAELEKAKLICEQQAQFCEELQLALENLLHTFKDSNGKTHEDYFNETTACKEELNELVEDHVLDKISHYADNRTRKWQESEAGSKFRSWFEMWDDFRNETQNGLDLIEMLGDSRDIRQIRGIDCFLELPPINACEVEGSYQCW